MVAARRVRVPVEEMAQDRHVRAASGVVESAVRAAGGFPTQGGGSRVDASVHRPLGATGAGA